MTRVAVTEVVRQLVESGLLTHASELTESDHSVRFVLTPLGREALARDHRFANGALHRLHEDVGQHRQDYRAYKGTFGPGSLQIVLDTKTGAAYADVDNHNPYADVVGFLGHTFIDVLPNWFRRRFRKKG